MNRGVLVIGAILVVPLLAILVINIGRDPRRIATPMVGRAAPPFTLKEAGTGKTVSLQDLRGKPVVVNFWASWCPPCLEEHPALLQAARTLGADVHFVGVAYEDSEESILGYLRRQGAAYPTLLDPGSRTAIAYGVFGVPETFFLDAGGVVAAKFVGPLTAEALAAHIQKARGATR